MKIPSLPTNLPTVDWDVLGCGGLPKGRIIEVFGGEGSGKTTFALWCIAQAQKAGLVGGLIDAEHALDPAYAEKIGVNLEELAISQPDYGEQALEVAEALIESKAVDILVIDSVTALVPLKELEGDMGDSHMGLQARLMSQAMRKLVGPIAKSGCVVIFINQVREKVGISFGNPEVTTGGRALKFFSSTRLQIARVSKSDHGEIMDGDKQIGHKMRVTAVKNKAGGAPYAKTIVELYYANGFDVKADTVEKAINLGLVVPGAWCVFDGKKYRKDDLTVGDVYAKIESEVKKATGGL